MVNALVVPSWAMRSLAERLRRSSLVRDSAINLLGQGIPLLTALFTFPRLIVGLGDERFGALSLAWTLTGYANIFDFGLGRALTHMVAHDLGRDRKERVDVTAWTAILVSVTTGLLATLAMYAAAPLVVDDLLHLEGAIRAEALGSLRLIALFLPVVILTTGLRGLLEAYSLFRVTNSVRIPAGVFNYLAPLLVLAYSSRLEHVVLAVIVTRCLETVAYFLASLQEVPEFTLRPRFSRQRLRELFRFGGWMTVSNLIAPIMLNFDRFFIASLTSLTAVTHYVTPQTIVTRLRVVPTAIMGVLFPAFSRLLAANDRTGRRLYLDAIRALVLLLTPLVVMIVIFAKPGLSLWVGPDFAERSYRVAQILAIGVLIHAIGQTPFTLLQARGRAAVTASVHLLEVPFYVAYLYLLVRGFGIEGAAAAWLLRVTLSTVALTVLAERSFRQPVLTGKTPAS